MANFNTHVSVAFLSSGSTALLAINNQLINWVEAPWFIFLGTVGGLLPDIDSDNSKQVKIVFFLLAIMSTFTLLTEGSILQGIPSLLPSSKAICHVTTYEFSSLLSDLSNQCLPYSLILITFSVFAFVRYILFSLFKSLTVHRGVFHSLLAAVFFAFLTTCICYYFLKQEALSSWLSGLFVCIGFIIHLLLDELYSVDLSNAKIKRSFGTAFKVYGYQSTFSSIFMLLCTLYLYDLAPSTTSFINALQAAIISPKTNIATVEKKNNEITWIKYLQANLKENSQPRAQTIQSK